SKLSAALSERRRTSRKFSVGLSFTICFDQWMEADKAITLYGDYRRECVVAKRCPVAQCWQHAAFLDLPSVRQERRARSAVI
ncbi:MAG: hypothetical protein WBM76_17185, partial [Woeseiaceae bacterium]